MGELFFGAIILILIGGLFWYIFPHFLSKYPREYPEQKTKCEYCGKEADSTDVEKGTLWFCCAEHEALWNQMKVVPGKV